MKPGEEGHDAYPARFLRMNLEAPSRRPTTTTMWRVVVVFEDESLSTGGFAIGLVGPVKLFDCLPKTCHGGSRTVNRRSENSTQHHQGAPVFRPLGR